MNKAIFYTKYHDKIMHSQLKGDIYNVSSQAEIYYTYSA